MATFPDISDAVYTALVGNSGVTDLVSTRVYDKLAGTGATLPYIVFDVGSGGIPNYTGIQDLNFVFRVHSWSTTSNANAKAIHQAVYTALHQQPITLTDWVVFWQACDGEQEFVETIQSTQYWHFVWDVRIRAMLDVTPVSSGFDPATDVPGALFGLSVHEDDIANVWQNAGTPNTNPATSDGDVIGAVEQLTGFGAVDASQTTTAAKPLLKTGANGINNHNAALFDGLNDFWDITGVTAASGAKTVYVVYKPISATGTLQYLLDVSTGRLILCHLTDVADQTGYFDNVFRNIATATNTTQIMSWVLGSSVGTLYRNGTSIGSDTYIDKAIGGTAHIGKRYNTALSFFNGLIGEILIYNAAHSTAERESMEAHLASKWGITLA